MLDGGVWVGLDIGADSLSACMTGSDGVAIAEEDMATNADVVASFIQSHAVGKSAVIGLEAGAYSISITRKLRAMGFPVHAFETRQASKFLTIRQNKTDTNDARGIAHIVQFGRGVVSEVHVKSVECQLLRSKLVLRQKLLRQRLAGEAAINSIFRLNGGKLKRAYSNASLRQNVVNEVARIREAEGVDLAEDIFPAMEICAAIRRHLEVTDRKLIKLAAKHSVCSRFLEIPGVGFVTALSVYSAIEDPSRFKRNEDVGPYFGLAPRVRQSGQMLQRLGVSKMGNSMTRRHLITAASILLRRVDEPCALRMWAKALADRSNCQRARTALARKLAVVMISIWKSGESYRPK